MARQMARQGLGVFAGAEKHATPRTGEVPIPGLRQKLDSVSSVLDVLRIRKANRMNRLFDDPIPLNLRRNNVPLNAGDSEFTATIDGKDLVLTDTALDGCCRLIDSTWDHFKRYDDPDALPKAMNNISHNRNRGPLSLLVRHSAIRVEAVLPKSYQIQDDFDTLTSFITELDAVYPNSIQGIERLVHGGEQGDGSHSSYRLVLGGDIFGGDINEAIRPGESTILRGMESPMFLMAVLSSSELGLTPSDFTLGLWRLVCRNGAMRLDQKHVVARWNHTSDMNVFYNKAFGIMRRAGMFQTVCSQVFSSLREQPLELPASELLVSVKDEGFISKNHFEAADSYLTAGIDTDSGEHGEVETAFQFFNVLTRSAQDLESIKARQRGETAAMKLAMHPLGFMNALSCRRKSDVGRLELEQEEAALLQ